MKFWWAIDSSRLGKERSAVEEVATSEGWFTLTRWCFHEGMFCAVGVIKAHGHDYPIRLVYPDQFPEVPAWVEPQEDARWTTHQYGTGILCLELRPDNWVASATGADVLRSAYNLLQKEDPLGTGGERAPSAHTIGEVQSYGWGANPVLIGAGCRERVGRGEAAEIKALRWMATDDIWPILVCDADDRASAWRPPGSDIYTWRVELPVYVSFNAAPSDEVERAALIELAGFPEEIATYLLGATSALILFSGGTELVAFHLLNDGGPHKRQIFVLPDDRGVRSGRTDAAQGKQVAIVGAGSVGSKVAEVLLRSGISRLTLVDGDVLLPSNLERHALDWRDVGFRKVHGLKRRLLQIAPGADITAVDSNLNWQRSAKTHAWQVEAIGGCDLIIDATGDPGTALFLGAVSDANRRPFVSVEVFEGGIGGLVATSLPERDPPYAEGRAAFLAWCDEQGVKPPESGRRRYEALAEDGTPFVADDAAATMTAAHAARVVLDILDGKPAPIDSAWLLLGYSNAWKFDGHGHTIRLSVGARRQSDEAGDDPEARDFAVKLFKEWLDES
ncbi:ThiF family adenylyltransferase [Neorhizobium sp. DT-125]|uniref:ThiF family adenylyltransferase n=1 Tax=Neorhizobium sp. DT-125 TaxID=3396163 RepID=UPI003F1CA41C